MNEANNNTGKKLVNVGNPVSLDMPAPPNVSTKKRIRHIADPHIRPHKVKGRTYYTYCRGVDKEIYLGDADTILNAITFCRKK